MKKFFAYLLMLSVLLGFSMATIGCGGAAKKPADTTKPKEGDKKAPEGDKKAPEGDKKAPEGDKKP